MCGAAAGIVGTTCNTPFDVVKSRMQNQITLPGQQPKYRWSFQGVAVVFREEGCVLICHFRLIRLID